MRKMKSSYGSEINVVEHIIVRNMWEYYVTDEGEGDIKFCLVLGYENELGDVYMPEIAPYIISRTKNLDEVAPAPDWQWVEEEV